MSEKNNIEKLLSLLRSRLKSSGKRKSIDEHGNSIYVDCDIFANDSLVNFLKLALSEFNQTPHFTSFELADSKFIDQFSEILVEGATLYALSSQALIEKGREYQLSDNGIAVFPPEVSEMLNTQYSTLLTHHWEKLKFVKQHIKDYK